MPICTNCLEPRDDNDFNVRRDRRIGRTSWCKMCLAAENQKHRVHPLVQQEARRVDPNRFRGYELKKLYGLSRDEWEALFESQGKRCAICGTDRPTTKKGWNTDHDHATNEVRGILCGRCNSILGYAKENIAILLNAIRYLEKHKGKAIKTWLTLQTSTTTNLSHETS